MSKIKVTNFTISLDGFGAGVNQSMKEGNESFGYLSFAIAYKF